DKMTMLSIGKGILNNKSEKIDTLRIPVDNSFTDLDVRAGRVLDIDFDKNIEEFNNFLEGKTEIVDTKENNAN
uniref:hypothetical protein n=1 Tax=Escherichia coli TaxID=562 RepID=UPI001CCB3591